MANTVDVTKVSVEYVQKKLFNITLNLSYKEDTVEKINKNYSILYAKGTAFTPYETKIIEDMQDDIDGYQAAQNIYNNAAFDTSISNIEAGLDPA